MLRILFMVKLLVAERKDLDFFTSLDRFIYQSINRVYFQTKCEQSNQININQISLIIIMHW